MQGQTDHPGAPGAQPASHAALPKGTRLQEFQVVEVVGEGGFGIVYLADDLQLHRSVAIKEYMPASLASRGTGESVVVRSEQHMDTFQAGMKSFISEARMLAQFKHPALVEVLRFWEQNGTAYMAMPYYKGRTLRQVLSDAATQVDERWLKMLFAPVMDALELMHAQNIYHRDVAPDNILILSNGAPVLLDLGAARRIIGDLTQAVTVVLKPGYAPVEQYADDGSATQGPWTDIYAVGAVMYFAITGRAPVASVSRIMKDTLKPLDAANHPAFSEEFLSGVGKALAVKPEDRPRSIAELRDLLGVSSYAATTMYPPRTQSPAPKDTPPPSAAAPLEPTLPASALPPRTVMAAVAATQSVAAQEVTQQAATAGPSGPTSVDNLFAGETPEAALGSGLDAATPPQGAPDAGRSKPAADSKARPAAMAVPAKRESSGSGKLLAGLAGLAVLGVGAWFLLAPGASGPEAPTPASAPSPAQPQAAQVPADVPAPATPPAPEPAAQSQPQSVPPTLAQAPVTVVPDVSKPTPESKPSPAATPATDKITDAPKAVPEGRVRFTLHPWGEVWIDGAKRGISPPLQTLKLPVGSHRVELRNPGSATMIRHIEVRKGAVIVVEHSFAAEPGVGFGGY